MIINKFLPIKSIINTLYDLSNILKTSNCIRFNRWIIYDINTFNINDNVILCTNTGKYIINLPILPNIYEYNYIYPLNDNFYIKNQQNIHINNWYLRKYDNIYALITDKSLQQFNIQLHNFSQTLYQLFQSF